MALPIRWSFPSLSEITSPSAGLPKTFSTSPENIQSCPWKIRALGLTTMPAMKQVMIVMTPLRNLELPGISKLRSGKVREVFDLGDTLLFVATDRLSAFDVILPDPIPDKGAVLNQISAFWFRRFDFVKNHVVADEIDKFPAQLAPFRDQLRGRSMIVRKTKPLPVEGVVRGYLAGSGWKEYQQSGSTSGVALPKGLQLASQLPEPIFAPSTKSEAGHVENIDWEKCCALVGRDVAEPARDLSLRVYQAGREHAAKCGIIVADTKFEFGLLGDELLLIDECLTRSEERRVGK